jgi:citrate lyase subunit beta/citryl-CoA lyase
MQVRSYLYVPADNQRFLDKIEDSKADAIILDLEDSVKAEAKSTAEQILREFLNSSKHKNLLLRVEPTRLKEQSDLINHAKIKKIYLPKAETTRSIQKLNEVNHSNKPIHALIESALGVESLAEIAKSNNIKSIGIGETDLFAELSLSGQTHSDMKCFVRSKLVITSSAYNLLPPTAPVSSDFKDLTTFESETKEFLDMGYWGRACIHPAQIDISNMVFASNPELEQRARNIVQVLENSRSGATVDDEGKMIDVAHLKWARRYLNLKGNR